MVVVGIPDCLIRAGTYGHMPPLPATPGTEIAGTMRRSRPASQPAASVQRVYTTARERPHRGSQYAEYVTAPVEATFLLPDNVDYEGAAALANYQVAYHMFNDALQLRRGQTVLIYGASGGIGNALIDLAKAAGLSVIGVVGGEDKARLAGEVGADHVINRKIEKVGGEQGSRKSRAVVASRPSSIRVAEQGFPDNIAMRAPCGTLLIYGALGGKAPLDLLATPKMRKNSPAVWQFTIHTWDDLVAERPCWNASTHRHAGGRQASSAHP